MKQQLLKISIIVVFLGTLSLTSFSVVRIITSVAPDFSVMWLATRDLPIGRNPYLNPDIFTGVGYPPNTLLFYLPLISFPYKIAQAIFIFLSLASIIGSVYLSLKITLTKVSWFALFSGFSLAFLSFPMKFTLGMGQNNSIALLLLLLAYYFYLHKKLPICGILLGSAITLKTIFIFFLLFFLAKREWKIIFYSVIVIGFSIFLVGIFADISLYSYYLKEIVPSLLNLSGREIYYNQGVMGFVSRLSDSLDLRKNLVIGISVILVSITTLLSVKKKNPNLLLSLFIITLLLIDSLSWQHHFVWLIFPFTLLASHFLKKQSITLLCLLGISFLLVSWNFKNPVIYSNFPLSLVLSHVFYGTVILFFLCLHLILRD
jgi:alpha-1,2-mannosyltransferase